MFMRSASNEEFWTTLALLILFRRGTFGRTGRQTGDRLPLLQPRPATLLVVTAQQPLFICSCRDPRQSLPMSIVTEQLFAFSYYSYCSLLRSLVVLFSTLLGPLGGASRRMNEDTLGQSLQDL
jgi:hypothetical protein